MSESGEMNELNEMCRAGFQFVVESVAKQELAEQKARSRSKNRNQISRNRKQPDQVTDFNLPTLPIEYFPLNSPLYINGYQIDEEPAYPMLLKVTKMNFDDANLYEISLTEQEKEQMKLLPRNVRKFYLKRNFLFTKFNQGIQLDEESWYSVIPECMGKYITQRLKIRTDQLKWKDVKVVDAFCGSGGLAIQMAQEFKDIEASDIDPIKIANLKHNMKIYSQYFPAHTKDYFELTVSSPLKQTLLILCPPWGGTCYLRSNSFDLDSDMTPSLTDILVKAVSLSENFIIQLPRNIKIKQLITIFQRVLPPTVRRFCLDLEIMYINDQINQIFVYYGEICGVNHSQEIDWLHRHTNLAPSDKQSIKIKLKQLELKGIYQGLVLEDQFQDIENHLQAVKQVTKKITKPKTKVKQWSLDTFLRQNKVLSQKYEDI